MSPLPDLDMALIAVRKWPRFTWRAAVVCVVLVSHYLLGERLGVVQLVGFATLAVAMILIMYRP